jgi:hypothetical protein
MHSIVMIVLAVCLGVVLFLAGASSQSDDTVGRYIDHDAGVVCWTYQRGGISCMPFDATTLQR